MTTPEQIPAPQPPAPPAQTPYGPQYAYAPARPTNGLAIGALVTSIVSFFVCMPVGVAGVIMGHIARRQIRERDEDGDGLALAGIILGWIAAALTLVIVLLFVAFLVWGIAMFPSEPSPAPSIGGF
jgi:hypothetical protein